ncbi:MAG: hypothetical protein OEW88_08285 [Gammaproteobacteria bacterium]|nr:hypothetical protein [Gammaproteobacteria bacterium]
MLISTVCGKRQVLTLATRQRLLAPALKDQAIPVSATLPKLSQTAVAGPQPVHDATLVGVRAKLFEYLTLESV